MGTTNQADEGIKSYFTFENFPLTITIGLIAMSWLSALSVIFFG
ncbi:hypothetical protein [Methylobacillus arboreus]|nr:hypothetical protein [Methylobacillus arboreus]